MSRTAATQLLSSPLTVGEILGSCRHGLGIRRLIRACLRSPSKNVTGEFMKPVTHQNLGIVIAYLLPGFAALGALSLHSPTVHSWFGASGADSPTVGGFLYVTVASLALGLFLNSARSLLLDPLNHRTGVRKNDWDYSRLQANLTAVEFVLAYQYRYYQFTGNMLLAIALAYPAFELHEPGWSWGLLLAAFAVEATLFFSARRILQTYYRRLDEILGLSPRATLPLPVEQIATEELSETVDRKRALGYDH
jgi:hypothetical protein